MKPTMFSYPMITQVLDLSKMTCSNPRKNYGAGTVYGSQRLSMHPQNLKILVSTLTLFSGIYSQWEFQDPTDGGF